MKKPDCLSLENTTFTAIAGTSKPQPAPGRPSVMTSQLVDALCSIIRETGTSDSGAAAQMSLHPSTVSRWKKEHPDFAILLRSAREDFRQTQISIIINIAHSGRAAGLRAATWLLERVFPEDYSPRAAERAKFRERFDAICESEAEGGMVELPAEGEALQNVKNALLPAPPRPVAPAPVAELDLTLPLKPGARLSARDIRLTEEELQNVKNAALAGQVRPPAVRTSTKY